MKCPVCQNRLRASAIFCDTCGSKLDKNAEATISLPKTDLVPKPPPPRPAPVGVLLSGAAILLVGLWIGATFFSAAPALSPRETTTLLLSEPPSDERHLSGESPASAPVTHRAPLAEAAPAPIPSPPRVTHKDGHLVDPFDKKASTLPASDGILSPFQSKKAPKDLLKKNADATLKPRFDADFR